MDSPPGRAHKKVLHTARALAWPCCVREPAVGAPALRCAQPARSHGKKRRHATTGKPEPATPKRHARSSNSPANMADLTIAAAPNGNGGGGRMGALQESSVAEIGNKLRALRKPQVAARRKVLKARLRAMMFPVCCPCLLLLAAGSTTPAPRSPQPFEATCTRSGYISIQSAASPSGCHSNSRTGCKLFKGESAAHFINEVLRDWVRPCLVAGARAVRFRVLSNTLYTHLHGEQKTPPHLRWGEPTPNTCSCPTNNLFFHDVVYETADELGLLLYTLHMNSLNPHLSNLKSRRTACRSTSCHCVPHTQGGEAAKAGIRSVSARWGQCTVGNNFGTMLSAPCSGVSTQSCSSSVSRPCCVHDLSSCMHRALKPARTSGCMCADSVAPTVP